MHGRNYQVIAEKLGEKKSSDHVSRKLWQMKNQLMKD